MLARCSGECIHALTIARRGPGASHAGGDVLAERTGVAVSGVAELGDPLERAAAVHGVMREVLMGDHADRVASGAAVKRAVFAQRAQPAVGALPVDQAERDVGEVDDVGSRRNEPAGAAAAGLMGQRTTLAVALLHAGDRAASEQEHGSAQQS